MKNTTIGGIMSAAAVLVAMHVPIQAFAEEQRVLEEIIVTATRTETSLQDTSIAVSAFTSDMMEDMNLDSGMDYEALVPSLSIQLIPNRTSIRGVGRFDNSLGIAPGVAMYEDGGYNQENTAFGVDSMNTERVEILRGPQGTLFGRNTTGGAINIISKRPTDELFFETRASAGNYGTRNAKFLLSGPLTDTIRGKIYYSQWWGDGLYDNIAGQDTRGATNGANYYAQWQLDWQPTDRLYIWYKGGNLNTSLYSGGTAQLTPYDPYNVCTSVLGIWCAANAQVQAGIEAPLDEFTVDIQVGDEGLDNHLQTTFHVIYDFDNVQMKYISYHNRYDWYYLDVDFDGTSNEEFQVVNDIRQEQRIQTHEITFASTTDSPLQWITGAYYMDDVNWQPYTWRYVGTDSDFMENIMVFPADWPNVGAPTYAGTPSTVNDIVAQNPDKIVYHQDGYFDNQNWSVFGELNYAFNDEWAITLGARYSEDDMKGTETRYVYGDSAAYWLPAYNGWCPYLFWLVPDPNDCLDRGAVNYPPTDADGNPVHIRTSKDDYQNTTGRIIVDYTPDEDNLYWFTLASGFKVGGLRLGSMEGIEGDNSPFFDGEEVLMYELGWKGSVSDTLNLETIVFYYDYSDMQQIRDYRDDIGISHTTVENVDAEMYGFEATMTWLATGNLMLYATYSYNHAEFSEEFWLKEDEFQADGGQCDMINELGDCMHNLDGNRLDITPDHKFALNAMYTIYSSMGEIQFGGTFSHVGEREMDIFNSPELTGDAYDRLDLSASWRSNDEHWKIEAKVKNVTDELWFNTKGVGRNSNEGTNYPYTKYLSFSGNPANPRIWTLEFQYNL